MSAHSVCVAPFALTVPNEDWEAPPYPPPPPAPPLPICVQKEVKESFSDGTMSSIEDDMVKKAVAKVVLVEKKTRELLLEMAAGGRYSGLPFMARFDGDLLSKIMDRLNTEVFLKQVDEKQRKRAEQEPKFVMYRTVDIKFLNPATFVFLPEGGEMEVDGWVWV